MSTIAAAPLWFRAARAVVRRLPAGRFRAFDRLVRRPLPPFEDRLGPEAGGYRYRCDLRHLIARETCLTGRYAPMEGALVRASLAPGDTFVDVGANFGYFTLLAAAVVGPAGVVVALEPDPRMAEELRGNVERNGLERVRVLPVAASDREGRATLAGFAEGDRNWGVSSLLDGGEAGAAPRFEVPCAPLDALLDDVGIDGVALVKVDVEGAEWTVLRGMREGLRRRRYRRVMVELHPWLHTDGGAELREMMEMMDEAGYRGWLLDDDAGRSRRAFYGASPVPVLAPLDRMPSAGWPHLLWTRPGAEPA